MERRGIGFRKFVRTAAMIAVSAAIVFGVFRLTEAGSLTPPASPAGTLDSVASLSDALFGTAFDSSAITASSNGNVLEVTKCIIQRLNGGTCP